MIEGEGDHNCSSGNEAEMFGEMLMRHKLEAMAYKKPKPGTFCKYQTEDRLIKTERMKKTRLIKELTRIGGKLKTHNKEPVECLFIIKNKSTNRFKYVGFGDVCEKFESGLPITKHISKCRKYTFPEQGYFPNTEEVNKDIEQLTPNKYSFGFIDTGNQQSTSSNMTLCELQKKRINSMEINDLETINIKRKRELFSQKARGKGARGGGRQQFREISSDSESQSDGAVNKRLKKANRGRGRGRGAPKGKGRGKTSQRRTTEANAPEQQEEKDLSDEIPIIIHERKRNNVPKAGTSNDHDDSLNISNTTLNDLFPIDGASEIEMEDGTTISFRELGDVFEQHMDDSEEVQAPEVKAPEVQAPEIQASEVQAPEVDATKVQAPEVQAPEVDATKVQAPEVQAPEVDATKVQAPEVQAPEVQAPEIQASAVQAPEVQAPEVQATEVQAPEVQASEVQAPEVQASEVLAPEVQATQVKSTDESQPIPAAQLHTTCTRNVPKENDFVRVKFVVKARGSTKEQYFIGQVVELIDGEPVVSFLKDTKDSQLKQWPDKTDLALVDPSMITDILQEPETVLTGRRLLLKFN